MKDKMNDIDCVEIENSVSHFYSDSPIISHSLLSSNLITSTTNNIIITVPRSKESFDEDTTVLNPVLSADYIMDRGLPLAHRMG
jgi:hypothetical protein